MQRLGEHAVSIDQYLSGDIPEREAAARIGSDAAILFPSVPEWTTGGRPGEAFHFGTRKTHPRMPFARGAQKTHSPYDQSYLATEVSDVQQALCVVRAKVVIERQLARVNVLGR